MSKLENVDRPFWRTGIYKRLGGVKGWAAERTMCVQGMMTDT